MLSKRFAKEVSPLSLQQLVSESNGVPWNRNWDNDKQPGNLSIDDYLALARRFRIQALLTAKNILEKCPNGIIKDDSATPRFYSLDGRDYNGVKTTPIDTLIREIQANDEVYARWSNLRALSLSQFGHASYYNQAIQFAYPNFKPDDRFLKSKDSADRKLADNRMKGEGKDEPRDIGDYLRLQILFDNAHDVALARHTIQFGNLAEITSQKDRLRFPDKDSGHRAFLVHALAYAGHQEFKYEIMVGLLQAEVFGRDKVLRDSQRTCEEAALEYAYTSHGLNASYSRAAKALEQLRKIALFDLYEKIQGMKDMLDPSIDEVKIVAIATHQASQELNGCEKVMQRLPKALPFMDRLFH
jgi:hypothetical protein